MKNNRSMAAAQHEEKTRKLSPWRVLLGIIIFSGIVGGAIYGTRWYRSSLALTSKEPWFAAYVDVTSIPTYSFEQLGATDQKDVVLSFIVSSSSEPCSPSWGAAYSMEQASATLDLDRRIARLQQQGGGVAVSFGGLLNNELAVGCTDHDDLVRAYSAVIERYDLNTIDLDLEKTGLTDRAANERRAKAIAEIQSTRRAQSKTLAVWVTLPVAPQGLTEDGTNGVAYLLGNGVDLAGVNLMTMNYGQSRGEGESMFEASKRALMQSHRQLGILYQNAGIYLNSATLWSKIGATPMIGQNDVPEEVFSLEDAVQLNELALSQGVSRMSMWSANRDVPCGSNYVDLQIVSDSCSGVEQSGHDYMYALSKGLKGSLSASAGIETVPEDVTADQITDDPSTSPYQIWKKDGTYLQGTKVVWHRNVYEAKWWTQGDVPDNPVLQSWQTPWDLIGPVLPGEKPIPQATLPEGTYPEWNGDSSFDTNERVLFEGVPYQAKWWTRGDSPAAASSNPTSSPWVPLTQQQIEEVIAETTT